MLATVCSATVRSTCGESDVILSIRSGTIIEGDVLRACVSIEDIVKQSQRRTKIWLRL